MADKDTQVPGAPGSHMQTPKPERRYDIDWLRFLAVVMLFLFHAARVFNSEEDFYAKNGQVSEAMTHFVSFVHTWHMPLFFLLAGASTWFALCFRSGGDYTRERLRRLLIPFIFGILVIIPPQTYIGLISHSDYAESFLRYYPDFFRIIEDDMDGYFLGGFTMGHLWFVFFLLLFSLLAIPLFLWLKREAGRRLTGRVARFLSLPGMILLPAIPLAIVGILPEPFGLNLLLYFVVFAFGYILIADRRFGEAIDKDKAIALVLGPVLYAVVFVITVVIMDEGRPDWLGQGFMTWFFLIALLGYGRQFLNFTNRFLKYVSEASYPVYILHQTMIVIIGYYVVQWDTSILAKFVAIVCISLAVTFLVYDLLIKRIGVVRFLFGMGQQKRIQN